MYEVFNYITGETIGFTPDIYIATLYVLSHSECDYINADTEAGLFVPSFSN